MRQRVCCSLKYELVVNREYTCVNINQDYLEGLAVKYYIKLDYMDTFGLNLLFYCLQTFVLL